MKSGTWEASQIWGARHFEGTFVLKKKGAFSKNKKGISLFIAKSWGHVPTVPPPRFLCLCMKCFPWRCHIRLAFHNSQPLLGQRHNIIEEGLGKHFQGSFSSKLTRFKKELTSFCFGWRWFDWYNMCNSNDRIFLHIWKKLEMNKLFLVSNVLYIFVKKLESLPTTKIRRPARETPTERTSYIHLLRQTLKICPLFESTSEPNKTKNEWRSILRRIRRNNKKVVHYTDQRSNIQMKKERLDELMNKWQIRRNKWKVERHKDQRSNKRMNIHGQRSLKSWNS